MIPSLSTTGKRTYNGLPDLMTKVASEELKRLDDSITECGVSYLPQVLFTLTVFNDYSHSTSFYKHVSLYDLTLNSSGLKKSDKVTLWHLRSKSS